MKVKYYNFFFIPLLLLLSFTPLFAETLAQESNLSIVFGAFLAGVLLTFTPCVLPMVPIVSSIIAGQGEEVSQRKALTLSITYVLGTAVSYALMGALAGATGEQLQSYFQNIWAVGIITLIFLFMALSMFGLFTLQLPSFIQSRLNQQTQGIKGGSLPMVFLLGVISALILGACVSPVLISFLGVAIAQSDPLLGATTMFSMAIGMGVPLIILGFGAGKLLPKVGGWMDNIKYFFGVMLLAVAIYIFNTLGLLPSLLLWGILFVGVAIYLGATMALKESATGWEKFFKAVGTLLLIWGILLLIGSAYNQDDMLHPLPKTSITVQTQGITTTPKAKETFTLIKTIDALEAKKASAKKAGLMTIVFFYTDWCGVCKHLKATTLKDKEVKKMLKKKYVALKVNMSDKTDEGSQELKKKFGVYGSPAFVIFDREGEELKEYQFYGYQDAEEFYDTLDLLQED